MGKDEKHRHFSREFKKDAVQLVKEKEMPVEKAARGLDIHDADNVQPESQHYCFVARKKCF
jgi:transposase-like protein